MCPPRQRNTTVPRDQSKGNHVVLPGNLVCLSFRRASLYVNPEHDNLLDYILFTCLLLEMKRRRQEVSRHVSGSHWLTPYFSNLSAAIAIKEGRPFKAVYYPLGVRVCKSTLMQVIRQTPNANSTEAGSECEVVQLARLRQSP